MDLPSEIWTQIFDLAADEDVIFQYGLPTVMAESVWFKNIFGEWTLRPPQEALNLIQRRSYATKKAIISTCKLWRRLGSEFLFRCLFFNDPAKLHLLCEILDSSSAVSTTVSSSIGWWTRRIHLTRYYASASRGTTMQDMENALISIIRHCPNLEIFIVDWPMGSTFGPVADALAVYASKSLRTVHWNVPSEALPKVIWALDSLPFILSAHIDFETPVSETQECIHLGAASDLSLTLPCLQQLSLRGYFQDFLEQATGWSIPALASLSFDSGTSRNDQPDAVSFLTNHGSKLIFLDLSCIPTLDVPMILDLCPILTTFTFNADWRIQLNEETSTSSLTNSSMSPLVNKPHRNITTIGLHGLMYAFGVGYAATYASVEPLRSHIIRRSNDLNMSALNKLNFPKLQRVRALNRSMLVDLNKEDGPAEEDGGYERWDRWWTMCSGIGVRLEDCTGALLGTLPHDEEEEGSESDSEEEEEDDEEGEYEDGEEEGDWDFNIPPMPNEGTGAHVDELRQLLEECRAMSEDREESMFPPMMGAMFGGGGGGAMFGSGGGVPGGGGTMISGSGATFSGGMFGGGGGMFGAMGSR